tara:strand:- start:2246 stop:3064 length:819 start_codon:yes stop_codon:yes gene_type:complete
MTKNTYNFGENKEEYHSGQGKKLPVWESPKYKQSKEKAIELIETQKYRLDTGDFWILMNATKTGKMMYTGLIISHNGCLKINDQLDSKLKFNPLSVSIVKDDGAKDKTMSYINLEQGIYEFGEISPKNCMNDYPYAMVLKRLMDRVILKNSKVGFFGIYSEAESSDFKDTNPESKEEAKPASQGETDRQKLAKSATAAQNEIFKEQADKDFKTIKEALEEAVSSSEIDTLCETYKSVLNKFRTNDKARFAILKKTKGQMLLDLQDHEDRFPM